MFDCSIVLQQQVVLKVVKTNLVVARLLASGHKKNQKVGRSDLNIDCS